MAYIHQLRPRLDSHHRSLGPFFLSSYAFLPLIRFPLTQALFYLLDKINGYRRLFSVTDTSLAHPYANPERIPVWLLAVLCGIVPAILIILAAFVRRSFWDAHNGILGLILGLGLTATFTDIIKVCLSSSLFLPFIRSPRPPLPDNSRPPPTRPFCTLYPPRRPHLQPSPWPHLVDSLHHHR